ncbi:hypothetical protein MJO28_012123 [Puccinia striiformis f. sp. tritici]|nr:hypothetical protein Pst134EA_022996 [Puccinia striiformis f. sp. tritici]POW01207.1 hypothetical protein PSTT_12632 [Puccinia striiformis]KAH9455536.1 hypothetical protein Pst134EA_022996 [Puccinia striiformis f. sp. tritici]KAI7942096.1 hypothetical protein MJO28_012123 [Puccinia striiformis f. sp. tritici]KAI7945920.1 hypothetical protein MJO29_012308 [Puccinia striiformis f. sp. tritici]POW15233.1 hypothetical protein PSHT_07159 [Puccinia striiformis]
MHTLKACLQAQEEYGTEENRELHLTTRTKVTTRIYDLVSFARVSLVLNFHKRVLRLSLYRPAQIVRNLGMFEQVGSIYLIIASSKMLFVKIERWHHDLATLYEFRDQTRSYR